MGLGNGSGESDQETLAKRIIHKLPGTSNSSNVHKHEKVEDYTSSVADSVIRELFATLSSEQANAVIARVIQQQATVIAVSSASKEARMAARIGAKEAFLGSYDAVEEKYGGMMKNVPPMVQKFGAPVGAAVGSIFAAGLLLSVWRFALFGLGPIF